PCRAVSIRRRIASRQYRIAARSSSRAGPPCTLSERMNASSFIRRMRSVRSRSTDQSTISSRLVRWNPLLAIDYLLLVWLGLPAIRQARAHYGCFVAKLRLIAADAGE